MAMEGKGIANVAKYFFGIIGVAMLFVIVFVRAGQYGGATGGEQAGQIMKAGTQGLTDIIRAATGEPRPRG